MNKNQKIALGCGGAGCLGLIVVVIIVVVLSATGYLTLPGMSKSNRNYNYNSNANRNSTSNSNYNRDSNSNSSSSSSMSDDDKHKLFQAAGMTKDNALIQRVLRKLGFITDSGVSEAYGQFVKEHMSWALKNIQFVQSVNTADKAREYVDAHIND